MTAMEQVMNEVLPAGFGYAWSDMSYQEKKAEGGQAQCSQCPSYLSFLILAALYESWSLPSAFFCQFLWLYLAPMGDCCCASSTQCVRPDRAHHVDWTDRQNAILIVEFAILEHSKGKELVAAALDGARLRLRPILMTSFAFILGCVPL